MFAHISARNDDRGNGQPNERLAHSSTLPSNHLQLPQGFEFLTYSMGCRINITSILIQYHFRKSLSSPAMGKVGGLLSQRTQSSSLTLK